MTQPYYHVSHHRTAGRARRCQEPPADGGLFVKDRARWLSIKRERNARRARRVDLEWEREKLRAALARGFVALALVTACLPLGGCPAFVMGVSAAGGLAAIGKDVFDMDVSWHQLPGAPPKTVVAGPSCPEKAMSPLPVVPK